MEQVEKRWPINVTKVDEDRQQFFGWAYVYEEKGKQVRDHSGDEMSADDVEKMAYRFTLDYRVGGDMHKELNKSRLIESMVFTKEKQEALGIDLKMAGWWVGFQVDDKEDWKTVKEQRKSLSIAGSGYRQPFKD